jgi:hypothetical protein
MNEQIEKLAEQCYETGPIGKDGWPEYSKFNYKKFAELIVQECMNQVREQYLPVLEDKEMLKDTYWDGYVLCGVDSYVAIREHFGVEE